MVVLGRIEYGETKWNCVQKWRGGKYDALILEIIRDLKYKLIGPSDDRIPLKQWWISAAIMIGNTGCKSFASIPVNPVQRPGNPFSRFSSSSI